MLEADLQRACVSLLGFHERLGHLTYAAIPNGSHLSGGNPGVRARKGRELKDQGMRKGVPDLVIILPDGRCGWAELKRPKGGVLSDEQKGWRDALIAFGHDWRLIKSLDDMTDFIAYMRGKHDDRGSIGCDPGSRRSGLASG